MAKLFKNCLIQQNLKLLQNFKILRKNLFIFNHYKCIKLSVLISIKTNQYFNLFLRPNFKVIQGFCPNLTKA